MFEQVLNLIVKLKVIFVHDLISEAIHGVDVVILMIASHQVHIAGIGQQQTCTAQ